MANTKDEIKLKAVKIRMENALDDYMRNVKGFSENVIQWTKALSTAELQGE